MSRDGFRSTSPDAGEQCSGDGPLCARCEDTGVTHCGDRNTGVTYQCTEFGPCPFLEAKMDQNAMMEAEGRVRRALGASPGESINEAAQRTLRDGMPSVALEVAKVILSEGEPWSRIFRAADLTQLRVVR